MFVIIIHKVNIYCTRPFTWIIQQCICYSWCRDIVPQTPSIRLWHVNRDDMEIQSPEIHSYAYRVEHHTQSFFLLDSHFVVLLLGYLLQCGSEQDLLRVYRDGRGDDFL